MLGALSHSNAKKNHKVQTSNHYDGKKNKIKRQSATMRNKAKR